MINFRVSIRLNFRKFMGFNFVICNWLIFKLGVGFGISMSVELFFQVCADVTPFLHQHLLPTSFFPKTNPLETKISLL